jgi:hypothetical protein
MDLLHAYNNGVLGGRLLTRRTTTSTNRRGDLGRGYKSGDLGRGYKSGDLGRGYKSGDLGCGYNGDLGRGYKSGDLGGSRSMTTSTNRRGYNSGDLGCHRTNASWCGGIDSS